MFLALVCASDALAATVTAALDRDTVIAGESATLTLTFEGAEPDRAITFPSIPNLHVTSQGTTRNVSINNGQVSSSVLQMYSLTPLQVGVYQIPSIQASAGGQTLSTSPLKLTALKPDQGGGQSGQQQLAFMRLLIPQKEVYVGQAVAVELQVFVRDGILNGEEILRAFDAYSSTPITAEGCRILRTAHATRQRVQVGGAPYTVARMVTAITPAKEGNLSIESIKAPLTLQLPVGGQRRRDIFDPFGMFQQSQPREVVLSAPSETLNVHPLPTENVPPGFSGAVGSYKLSLEAAPTNVAVGDPITVRLRVEGSGDLEALAMPVQTGWSEFKSYPATSKVQNSDALGLQGVKAFEQVLVPQTETITNLPSLQFSFFDPEKEVYRTLQTAAVPLVVRPGASTPAPAIASVRTPGQEEAPPAPDLVPIKRRLGSESGPAKPLILKPWFLALQLLPVAWLAGATYWRKRQDAWAANPRLRRKHEVRQKVRTGLAELRTLAAANNSDGFFLAVFRLLQERIGERLDLPATSITGSVVDEKLAPLGVPDSTLQGLRELFQSCDQARYAPARNSGQLEAFIPKVENTLQSLETLEL